MSISFKNT
uniref:Uncharacterized protein n=1 Tax=Anguilla anguilla TaxID=7936 RepID=A0A0E9XNY3_ANGAN